MFAYQMQRDRVVHGARMRQFHARQYTRNEYPFVHEGDFNVTDAEAGLRARPHRKHAQDARRVVVIRRRGARCGQVCSIARTTWWRTRAQEDFQPFKLATRSGEQRVRGQEKDEQQTQENTRPHVRVRL